MRLRAASEHRSNKTCAKMAHINGPRLAVNGGTWTRALEGSVVTNDADRPSDPGLASRGVDPRIAPIRVRNIHGLLIANSHE